MIGCSQLLWGVVVAAASSRREVADGGWKPPLRPPENLAAPELSDWLNSSGNLYSFLPIWTEEDDVVFYSG